MVAKIARDQSGGYGYLGVARTTQTWTHLVRYTGEIILVFVGQSDGATKVTSIDAEGKPAINLGKKIFNAL